MGATPVLRDDGSPRAATRCCVPMDPPSHLLNVLGVEGLHSVAFAGRHPTSQWKENFGSAKGAWRCYTAPFPLDPGLPKDRLAGAQGRVQQIRHMPV